jgi:hypothetical protein
LKVALLNLQLLSESATSGKTINVEICHNMWPKVR